MKGASNLTLLNYVVIALDSHTCYVFCANFQASESHTIAPVLGVDRIHAVDHDVHWTSNVQAREDSDFHCKNRLGRLQGRRQTEEGLGCNNVPLKAPQHIVDVCSNAQSAGCCA